MIMPDTMLGLVLQYPFDLYEHTYCSLYIPVSVPRSPGSAIYATTAVGVLDSFVRFL